VPLRQRKHLYGREVLAELHGFLNLVTEAEEKLHRQVARILLFVEQCLLQEREHKPGEGGAELVQQHLRRLTSVPHDDLTILPQRVEDDRQTPLEVRKEGGAAQVRQELEDCEGARLSLWRTLLRDARDQDV